MTPKPPIQPVRWHPPAARALPAPDVDDNLRVIELPGHAPEDVVADSDGAIWTGVDDGRILRITPDGTCRVVANTGGRPLGLAVGRHGSILICDSHRGLLRLEPATGRIESLVTEVVGRPLKFCSNAVESSDGTIYFTESTSRFHYEYYKGSVLEATASGSLFRRTPDGTVTTLADELRFANGVALTADESALIVAETTACQVSRYPLTSSGVGAPVPLIANLPAYPDNISLAPDGRIWVALVSGRNAIGEWLAPRSPMLRRALWRLPYRWLPDPTPIVWVISIDPGDGRVCRQLRTTNPRFGLATGVVEQNGTLWIGCIGASAIARLDL